MVRLQIKAKKEWIARVDNWRRKQPAPPSRGEAIRVMVTMALDSMESPPRIRSRSPESERPCRVRGRAFLLGPNLGPKRVPTA
jgi:hypothetical protein